MKNGSDIPPQYLKGWVEFYKLKFKVTPDVLIPRPETELLVDAVLEFILRATSPLRRLSEASEKFSLSSNNSNITIIDVGTGSGNIAISIAKNLPKARIFATDISEAALDVARENAKRHRVDKKIFFIKSDLLSAFVIPSERSSRGNLYLNKQSFSANKIATSSPAASPRNDGIDIIVTNLPYIPSSRIPYLDPSVKDFEPRVALDGGSDGFDLYRKLFEQISHKFLEKVKGVNLVQMEGGLRWHLNNLKLIVCEIDYTQGEIAVLEAQKYFPEARVEVKTDLSKKQRILVIRF